MKVTLRELFLLILVAALALGWCLDRTGLKTTSNKFEVEAYMACDLAASFARILQQDQNYSVDFSNGLSVSPVNGHNGGAFSSSGGPVESRVREMLEHP